MGTGFSLQQFSEVFQVRNADGIPYVLIGGQAVNYWAERYLADEPELEKYIPFASEDVDFRGNREDVRHIARQLKLAPLFPPSVAMTALAGVIPYNIGNLRTNIEVVRHVPGVAATAVDGLAIEAEWNGKKIRVLDPISLLRCKVELALTVSQENRQDVAHLKMLLLCVRGFLREFLRVIETSDLPVKGWLGAVNRLMQLAKSKRGRQVALRFDVNWSNLLPLPDIFQSEHEKIRLFCEKQLPGSVLASSAKDR